METFPSLPATKPSPSSSIRDPEKWFKASWVSRSAIDDEIWSSKIQEHHRTSKQKIRKVPVDLSTQLQWQHISVISADFSRGLELACKPWRNSSILATWVPQWRTHQHHTTRYQLRCTILYICCIHIYIYMHYISWLINGYYMLLQHKLL